MPLVQLASFPNSRVKPRPVRTTGSTDIQALPAGVVTLILPADPNRVTVLVRNLDSTESLWLGYTNSVDDLVGANGGMELKAGETYIVDDPRDIYMFNPAGVIVNIAKDIGQG